MTTIEFGKQNNSNISFVSIALSIFIITSFIWGIFIYNNLINLRHNLSKNKEMIVKAQVQNAELKEQLYKLTDDIKQGDFLSSSGLTLEKSPIYVVSNKLSINQ